MYVDSFLWEIKKKCRYSAAESSKLSKLMMKDVDSFLL